MSSIQSSKRFRELANVLRERADRLGVAMMPGEATELLASQISAVASQLGISERWALDRYVTEDFLDGIAQTIASQAVSYRETVSATEPVRILAPNTGRVIASLGMVLKLAAEHADETKTESMSIVTDSADALVSLGAVIRAADGAPEIEFGGEALVWTRSTLVKAIGLLRSGQWRCPCKGSHGSQSTCTLIPTLSRDLNLVGGWLSLDTD
jgi:hypothetical protein